MALIRSGWPGALAAALCVALTAACSATVPLETVPPEAAPPEAAEPNAASVAGLSVAGSSAAESKAVASKEAELKEIERSCPDLRDWTYDGKHSVWWETFRRTTESLRDEIARRADALKAGPVGNRAKELASLRLAATARDLLEADAEDGAVEALERAVSLYAGNGYAWLWLAHVADGNAQAREFADKAERTLPRDPGVRCELAGLHWELHHGGCKGYYGDNENPGN